jgi:TolA-binding protein
MMKVEGHSSLRRAKNGSVVTVDRKKLELAKAEKARIQEIKDLRTEVNELKEQINSLNNLFQELKNGR